MSSSIFNKYKEKPDEKIKNVWLLTTLNGYIGICLFLILIIFVGVFQNWTFFIIQVLFFIIVLLLVIMLIEIVYIYKYKYKLFSFEINDNYIIIQKRGWVYVNIKTIPIEKIYYIDVYKGPLLNKYNLCTLKIGTIAYVHDIEGIALEKVEAYKDSIYKENI